MKGEGREDGGFGVNVGDHSFPGGMGVRVRG